jgi:hypothetical protein
MAPNVERGSSPAMPPFVAASVAYEKVGLKIDVAGPRPAPAVETLIKEVADSGRCADLSQDPDSRVSPMSAVAPGPPPVLSFRYYEGKLHHRFENADLMLDDAGH